MHLTKNPFTYCYRGYKFRFTLLCFGGKDKESLLLKEYNDVNVFLRIADKISYIFSVPQFLFSYGVELIVSDLD